LPLSRLFFSSQVPFPTGANRLPLHFNLLVHNAKFPAGSAFRNPPGPGQSAPPRLAQPNPVFKRFDLIQHSIGSWLSALCSNRNHSRCPAQLAPPAAMARRCPDTLCSSKLFFKLPWVSGCHLNISGPGIRLSPRLLLFRNAPRERCSDTPAIVKWILRLRQNPTPHDKQKAPAREAHDINESSGR